MATHSTKWLRTLGSPANGALPLVCLPNAGAGAQVFFPWSRHLGASVAVTGVELPGRWARHEEPLLRRVPDVIGPLAAALAPLTARPYAMVGYSMGGLLAYELCRALRQAGRPLPRHLFVCGRRAPDRPLRREPMHRLPDAAFVARMRQTYGGIPDQVLREPDLMALFLPVMRADMEALETYAWSPGPPLACDLTVLGGLADPSVTADELDAWAQHTTGAFERLTLPGDHNFVVAQAAAVCAEVTRRLDRFTRADPG